MATIPRGPGRVPVRRSAGSPFAGQMPSPAGAVADISKTAFNLSLNMIDQQQATEQAQKEIEARNRLNSLSTGVTNGGFERGTDGSFSEAAPGTGSFSMAPDAYDALAADLKSEMLADIESNSVREAVSLKFDAIAGTKRAVVQNAAVKQMRDHTVAQLDINTELLQNQFAKAQTDAERLQILDTYRDNLVSAVQTRAITREDMVARTQKFRNNVAELEVREDLTAGVRSADVTESVLEKLRSGGYPMLQAEQRQKFEEQALRQFNSAVNFEWTMQQRREAAARKKIEQRQDKNTRALSALIRPTEAGTMGLPQAGHVEISNAFQTGQINRTQANYLRSLIDRPDPQPDPLTRHSWRFKLTAQAYDGVLNEQDVLFARSKGFIKDEDVSSIMSIHASRQAAGGTTATMDSKRALEFITTYLYGVKDMLKVELEDADVRELGILELQFQGRVGRGENPYVVAQDLIDDNMQDLVTVEDLPQIGGIRDMFLRHQRNGTMDEFWPEARETLLNMPNGPQSSPALIKGLVRQLERMKNNQGKKLRRMPAIREELRKRADAWERRTNR